MKVFPMSSHRLLPFLVCTALSFGASTISWAVESAVPPEDDVIVVHEEFAVPTTVEVEPDYRLTFEQLGARYPFNLRGVDGSDSISFNLRADEVVRAARLNLGYAYSPALLSDLSHINVLLNDEVALSIAVPSEDGGKRLEREIDLPAHLVTEFNQLRLQLVGHYTLECEDPLHSSLWANISNKSVLELSVDQLNLPNDLSIFPLPFFDHRDTRRLKLPFVFATDPDVTTLESAGMLASWFGAIATYRGASFPVDLNSRYPEKGNAIVLSNGNSAVENLIGQTLAGPTLAIITNPNDSMGKLLLVMGRDSAELKLAAQALVLGDEALTGSIATVTRVEQLKSRKPYDAPRWLPTDRKVRFGELLPTEALDVFGYTGGPVRISMLPPPDLFGWREKPVPLELGYRYTPQPGQANSSLLLRAGDQFLKSFPLLSVAQLGDESNWFEKLQADDLLPVKSHIEIPLARLLTRKGLEFEFIYDYIKEGQCRDIIIDNVRGHIDPESTIDLSRYPHFMMMPNLAAFDQSGFPFTRMADLSETAVVFSDKPSEHDFSTYLTLLGRFGDSTGYPAVGVTVAFGQSGLDLPNKDVVLVSTGNQAWLSDWAEAMPAVLDGTAKQFDTSDMIYKPFEWPGPDPRETQQRTRTELAYSSDGPNVVFAGFESPSQKGRSVVMISSGDPEGQVLASRALLHDAGLEKGLQGSLAVVHNGQIKPLVAEYTYSIGKLGFWRGLEWKLVQYWPGMPALGRVAAFIVGLVFLILLIALWRVLRRHRAVEK